MITLFRLIDDILNKRVSVYAAQAAFFLMISFVPFIMAFLNIMQFISPQTVDYINKLIGTHIIPGVSDILIYILNELYTTSSSTLMSVTLFGVIWTASKGIHALEYGLNVIYGNNQKNGYVFVRLLSFFYMILFFAMMILLVLVTALGKNTLILIKPYIPSFLMKAFSMISYLNRFRMLLVAPVMVLIFMILYTYFPGRMVRFRDQFFGALLASASWILFSVGFTLYIQYVKDYSTIYGSLGAVLLISLWIYFGILFIMLGAELNAFRSKHGRLRK